MIEIDENEQILMIVRKHWIIIVFSAIVLFLLAAIPLSMLFGLHFVALEKFIHFSGDSFYVGGFLAMVWLTIVWCVGWVMWTNYYLDMLIVTNKRLFNIEQFGLFRRESFSFRADRIQNVSVRVNGFIQTLLDYGTIRIETAGEREDFVATFVPHPYDVKRIVGELQDMTMDRTQKVAIDGLRGVPQAGNERNDREEL